MFWRMTLHAKANYKGPARVQMVSLCCPCERTARMMCNSSLWMASQMRCQSKCKYKEAELICLPAPAITEKVTIWCEGVNERQRAQQGMAPVTRVDRLDRTEQNWPRDCLECMSPHVGGRRRLGERVRLLQWIGRKCCVTKPHHSKPMHAWGLWLTVAGPCLSNVQRCRFNANMRASQCRGGRSRRQAASCATVHLPCAMCLAGQAQL
jgi:hypothetical protein